MLALSTVVGCGDDEPTSPGPGSATSIVGSYSGTYDYAVVRNATQDPETSLHCSMRLVITDEVGGAFAGRLEVMGPASGCGAPGDRYSVLGGTVQYRDIGASVEVTISPGLSSRVNCAGVQVTTMSGTFFAGSIPGVEAELRRGFVCEDTQGDWLTVNVTYTGSRSE